MLQLVLGQLIKFLNSNNSLLLLHQTWPATSVLVAMQKFSQWILSWWYWYFWSILQLTSLKGKFLLGLKPCITCSWMCVWLCMPSVGIRCFNDITLGQSSQGRFFPFLITEPLTKAFVVPPFEYWASMAFVLAGDLMQILQHVRSPGEACTGF